MTTTDSKGRVMAQDLAEAGIPPKYWEVMLKNAVYDEKQKHKLDDFLGELATRASTFYKIHGSPKSLVIYGPYGAGKTSIAVGIGKVGLVLGLDVVFITAASLIGDIINDRSKLKAIKDSDLLIVDNLNDELTGKWSATAFEDIIRHRYSQCKMTLITTNLTPKNIKSYVNAAVVDILAECGDYMLVKGKSWRRLTANF